MSLTDQEKITNDVTRQHKACRCTAENTTNSGLTWYGREDEIRGDEEAETITDKKQLVSLATNSQVKAETNTNITAPFDTTDKYAVTAIGAPS